jgi:fatty-acyl-CoA synthase
MDDLINVGGKKVAPDEVEELLRQHPDIADAACIAAPDPLLGEVVTACVVTTHAIDPAALANWLAPRLESHKLPRHFRPVDAIPRTASGKIQRARLRD